MASFVEIDGRRFEFDGARIWLYHCDSDEADWILDLFAPGAQGEATLWLAGTVAPAPAALSELDGRALKIEGRDLDGLFEALLGAPITTYPGGQLICEASFQASLGEAGLRLVSAFEFDWDRELDPPGACHPALRSARLELEVELGGRYGGELPEP